MPSRTVRSAAPPDGRPKKRPLSPITCVPTGSRKGRLGSPIHWYGGKGHLAAKLVKLLAPHDRFVDVFGGAGSVLLSKPPSAHEVWNDIDFDLYALFCVLQNRRRQARLLEMIEFTPHGRGQFEACLEELRNGKSGISARRAWATVVALNQSWNGCVANWTDYAYCRTASRNGMARNVAAWNSLPRRLAEAGGRMRKVVLENLPFEQVMSKRDGRTTLFLLDPPYMPETRRHKGAYVHEFGRPDHIRLLRMALKLKGKCLLCGHPHPMYDRMLTGWRRLDLTVPLNATSPTGGPRPKRVECVWLNYDPPSRKSDRCSD